MSEPHIILDNLPSLCQKLSDLVEVWCCYNKNNFACFFETQCRFCNLVMLSPLNQMIWFESNHWISV